MELWGRANTTAYIIAPALRHRLDVLIKARLSQNVAPYHSPFPGGQGYLGLLRRSNAIHLRELLRVLGTPDALLCRLL